MHQAAAGRILSAFEQGDVRALERAIGQSLDICRRAYNVPEENLERLDLLEAIALQMHGVISRIHRRVADRWEGAEAQLGLLRHLAAGG